MARIETMSYDFPGMRETNSIYVDKTQVMYDLIVSAPLSGFYFISRPRRFGKSLMISTFDSIFRGRRDLFEGLAISKTDYDWPVHPVIRFDFSKLSFSTLAEFEANFRKRVLEALVKVGVRGKSTDLTSFVFADAIDELFKRTGHRVVVLIDECDAPFIDAWKEPALAEAVRKRLLNFYIQLKVNIAKVRFLMMTGTLHFGWVTGFSSFNNVEDLTLDARAATMLGYTETELEAYFHDEMAAHAQVMGLDYEAYRAQLRFWYNGYHFSPRRLGVEYAVYNPYAISRTLKNQEEDFKATWATTGKPSMLMNYLSREQLVKLDYEKVAGVTEDLMAAANLTNLSAIGLLFQSGYLTIKDYDADDGYTLGIPDEEVRRDLLSIVAQSIAQCEGESRWIGETITALTSRDFPEFFAHLKALYADLPYGSTEGTEVPEVAYLRLLYFLIRSRFSNTEAYFERQQAGARSDLVLVHKRSVFIFELKVNRDGKTGAQSALAQIRRRNYAEPLRSHNLPIYAIGLAFDPQTHRLAEGAAEAL